MKEHYVTFYSPGTFVAETTTKRVKKWDVEEALALMHGIEERYHAKPYGFRFTTKKRGFREMNAKEVKSSGTYYVNCKVQTLADIEAEGGPAGTLAQNMRTNGWDRVATTTEGWSWSQPLKEGDVVL